MNGNETASSPHDYSASSPLKVKCTSFISFFMSTKTQVDSKGIKQPLLNDSTPVVITSAKNFMHCNECTRPSLQQQIFTRSCAGQYVSSNVTLKVTYEMCHYLKNNASVPSSYIKHLLSDCFP